MVQILERIPSFGENFARSFTGGLGGGLEKGLSIAEKLAGRREKALAEREKLAGKAWKNIPSYLKSRHLSLAGNPKATKEIGDFAAEILRSNADIPEDEAFELAVDQYKQSRRGMADENEGFFAKNKRLASERQAEGRTGGLAGDIAEYFKPAISAVKQRPSLLASELPSAVGKLEKGLSSSNDPFGSLMADLGSRLMGNKGTPNTPERMLAAHFRKDLPEELVEGAERIGDIESVLLSLGIPIPGLKGKINRIPGKAVATETKIGSKALQEATPAAEIMAKKPSLKGKVSREAPSTSTESRMERLSPKERLFETKKEQEIIHSQLKQHPRYAEEISRDASEMAARREKVLGPKALETKAQKIEYFEKQLPAVRKDYEKAISRVRALEDQLAKQPELKEQIKPLIQAATKQLEESQFLLKQTLNNSKTGSAKVGFEEMRNAAQKKVLDIEAKVGEGTEVHLPLRDYNPEFVRQAKQLAKKKSIPSSHVDDYFTQVHEGYAQVYRDRLKKLDDQIAKLSETKSLPSLHQRIQLDKERKVLNKLVDHVEAENAIHRHKLALRQTHERKLAQERLGKLKPVEGKKNISETAKPQIKEMGRIAESMKTSEGRSKLVDEFTSKMESKGTRIDEKQKSSLRDALDDMKRYSEEAQEGLKSAPSSKTPQEAAKKVTGIVHRIRDQFDKVLSKVPVLGATAEGKDFLVGVITSLYGELAKETDLPSSTIASAFLGRRSGAGTRIIGNALGKLAIKKWKLMNVKSAYRKEDDEKISKYQKKYGNKIMKEAREDLYGT